MQASRSVRCVSALLLASTFVIPGSTYRHDRQQAEASGARRPNILIIVTDDQREGLTVMPKTWDWLGRRGVNYPQAFVTTPTCCPSRSTIMTGRYAHNHGVRSNPGHGDRRLNHFRTLQAILKRNGYRTGLFGKFLNGYPLEEAPPYFDEWAISKGFRYFGSWNVNGTAKRPRRYSTSFIGDRTISFLERTENRDVRPWFALVTPIAPHEPYTAEKKYKYASVPSWSGNPAVFESDLSDKPPFVRNSDRTFAEGASVRRAQFRTLMSVDDLVARVRNQLRNSGELANTLVFFLSDNGFFWADHRLGGKDQPYTGDIKIPMLASWPGHFPSGGVDRRLVATVDVTATALHATGITPGWKIDGRSLLRKSWSRTRLLIEHWCNSTCLYWAATRTRRYQYIEHYSDPAHSRIIFREFYRLSRDPWQLRNVLHDGVPGNEPSVGKLHRQLARDRACSGWSCP